MKSKQTRKDTGQLQLIRIAVSEPALDAARKQLTEFPASYDALQDHLADRYNHAHTVNALLEVLRNLLREVR